MAVNDNKLVMADVVVGSGDGAWTTIFLLPMDDDDDIDMYRSGAVARRLALTLGEEMWLISCFDTSF